MWQIHLVKNDLKVPKKAVKDLLKLNIAQDYEWSGTIVDSDNKLIFNPDHFEHQDYLWNKDVQKVLKKYKAKGEVWFASLNGDNRGECWGHRFDGKGGYVEARCKMEFRELIEALDRGGK